jgi:hypothetical protein
LAQKPSDPAELLAKARDLVIARAKRLPNYVCVQTVDRQYFKYLRRIKRLNWPGQHPVAPSCAEIVAFDKENTIEEVGSRRIGRHNTSCIAGRIPQG